MPDTKASDRSDSEKSFTPGATEDSMRLFRNTLGQFATGVTIVTMKDPDDRLIGITANSFSSVSLDPPLVLWSVGNRSQGFEAFQKTDYFCINVLRQEQEALAMTFAKSSENKFDGVAFEAGLGGAPILSGSLAVFECRKFANYAGGDHVILVGQVERCHTDDGNPLLFYKGQFKKLG